MSPLRLPAWEQKIRRYSSYIFNFCQLPQGILIGRWSWCLSLWKQCYTFWWSVCDWLVTEVIQLSHGLVSHASEHNVQTWEVTIHRPVEGCECERGVWVWSKCVSHQKNFETESWKCHICRDFFQYQVLVFWMIRWKKSCRPNVWTYPIEKPQHVAFLVRLFVVELIRLIFVEN